MMLCRKKAMTTESTKVGISYLMEICRNTLILNRILKTRPSLQRTFYRRLRYDMNIICVCMTMNYVLSF